MPHCTHEHCWDKPRAKRKTITLRVRVDPATAAMIEQLQAVIFDDRCRSDQNGKPRTTTRTTSEILREAIECLFNSPKSGNTSSRCRSGLRKRKRVVWRCPRRNISMVESERHSFCCPNRVLRSRLLGSLPSFDREPGRRTHSRRSPYCEDQ